MLPTCYVIFLFLFFFVLHLLNCIILCNDIPGYSGMQGLFCLYNQKSLYSSFSVCPSHFLFRCSSTVIMKGISMSFCAKVQRTCLLCVLQSQFVMHILFSACITFDYTLIVFFLNVFCHFISTA